MVPTRLDSIGNPKFVNEENFQNIKCDLPKQKYNSRFIKHKYFTSNDIRNKTVP